MNLGDFLINWLANAPVTAVPYALAAVGLIVAERSGVLIAFLSRNDPIVIAVVGFLIAVLFIAGQTLQVFYQIPFTMVQMIEAIIVISVASSEFLIRHRIRWLR